MVIYLLWRLLPRHLLPHYLQLPLLRRRKHPRLRIYGGIELARDCDRNCDRMRRKLVNCATGTTIGFRGMAA